MANVCNVGAFCWPSRYFGCHSGSPCFVYKCYGKPLQRQPRPAGARVIQPMTY
jgi:hypothetical protein